MDAETNTSLQFNYFCLLYPPCQHVASSKEGLDELSNPGQPNYTESEALNPKPLNPKPLNPINPGGVLVLSSFASCTRNFFILVGLILLVSRKEMQNILGRPRCIHHHPGINPTSYAVPTLPSENLGYADYSV